MDTTAVDNSADFDAATELLRQAAIREGLLDAADPAAAEGVISAAASQAIEALLEREIRVPEPSEEACRRHHAAHAAQYTRGERAALRHVLFAVTPGVDVVALRKRAEACLLDVRCHDGTGADRFAAAARELSNCPSGANGGDLGWLAASDCAPECAREVFGHAEVGVLPRLVHSRFGLHVVEVLQRESGEALPFEAVRGAIEATLRQQSYATALRQYVQLLGGAESPLVQ
jgi:peptidyl-prolyl cis-trans isomerase C